MGRKMRPVREPLEVKLDYKSLVDRLRDELDTRRITRNEVAAHMEWHISTTSQKLHGSRPLFLNEFLRLCEFSGIYPTELFPEEVMAFALKRLSLFGYLDELVKNEVKKTISGDRGAFERFNVMLVPKADGPKMELLDERRGRPKKATSAPEDPPPAGQ